MSDDTPKPAQSKTEQSETEQSDPGQADPGQAVQADQTEKPMPTLWEQMGGMVGFVSASIPVAVFVIVNIATSMWPAIWSAVGVAVLIAVWRIVRKEQLMPAISGIFGVGIAAYIAYRTGEAKGFFLYGIWVAGGFGAMFLVSMIVRWPLVGVIWSTLNGHGFGWRSDRKSRLYYDIATLVFTLVFGSRVVVQQWLYNADETTLLGIAKLAMGYPLTILAFLVAIWAVSKVNHRDKIRMQEADEEAEAERQLRAKYDTPAQERS